MRSRIVLPVVLALVTLWSVPSTLGAAETDSSEYWTQKAVSFYTESAPYTLVYAMEMLINQEGAPLNITATGDILFASADRLRTDIEMTMAMEMLPQPIEMALLMVHDGETIWMEMDNPAAGGKQVMRMSADKAKEMQKEAARAAGWSSDQLDPVAQVEMFSELTDLSVVEISNGTVRLEGVVTEKLRQRMGNAVQLFGEDGLGRVTLILDEKTGAVRKMTMGDPAAPSLSMVYEDMKLIPETELPADAFFYSPPEGVPVRDLDQALEEAQAPNQGQEEPAAAAPVQ